MTTLLLYNEIKPYLNIIILAFIFQFLANFIIVFSLRNNIRKIKEMLQEIYIPYKEKNDYERSIEEEKQNRDKAILKEYLKQQKEQEKRKKEQYYIEIKETLNTALSPKIIVSTILLMITGIILMGIFFIFFS